MYLTFTSISSRVERIARITAVFGFSNIAACLKFVFTISDLLLNSNLLFLVHVVRITCIFYMYCIHVRLHMYACFEISYDKLMQFFRAYLSYAVQVD